MRDVSDVDMRLQVFGQSLSMPIFVSPAGKESGVTCITCLRSSTYIKASQCRRSEGETLTILSSLSCEAGEGARSVQSEVRVEIRGISS